MKATNSTVLTWMMKFSYERFIRRPGFPFLFRKCSILENIEKKGHGKEKGIIKDRERNESKQKRRSVIPLHLSFCRWSWETKTSSVSSKKQKGCHACWAWRPWLGSLLGKTCSWETQRDWRRVLSKFPFCTPRDLFSLIVRRLPHLLNQHS